jgi:hypothetical protein
MVHGGHGPKRASNRRPDAIIERPHVPRDIPRRSSKFELTLSTILLLASAGLLVVAVLVSFEILHGGDSGGGSGASSPLRSISIAGPEETVFDWSRDACEPRDIPDDSARAFRDATGRVQLIASHYVNRRELGADLGHLTHQCELIMGSDYDPLPESFNDHEWLASTYTFDGRTVFGLVHDEYHGHRHEGRCASGEYVKCWYNAITFARSDDGGRTYRQPEGSAKLIATVPYRYTPDAGPYGLFNPSNIVYREADGHYYFMARAQPHEKQKHGACLLRTRDLADPRSWRGWGGSGFDVRFIDPYRDTSAPGDHVCEPVSPRQIGGMSESLTWNTYLDRFLLVSPGSAYSPTRKRSLSGFFYSTSPDLVHWSERRLLREVTLPWQFECGDSAPVAYPSVLDPDSKSRNFETTGRDPLLFFTRFHYSDCNQTLNRDLVRVQLHLAK